MAVGVVYEGATGELQSLPPERVKGDFCQGEILVDDNFARIQIVDDEALIQCLEADTSSEKRGLPDSLEAVSTPTGAFVAVIESRTFIGECIRRTMQSAYPLENQSISQAIELQRTNLPKLILLSEAPDNKAASANAIKILSQIAPKIPIIVLAYCNDTEMAKAAISSGAKGYIPVTLGFEIAIEAVRFVLAGGTYVPIDYLLMRSWPGDLPTQPLSASPTVTARELAVVRAVQRGKSNKIIAYELGMCESTVKVHMRRIMKKLNAKNRTEVAIKSQTVMDGFPWSSHLSSNGAFAMTQGQHRNEERAAIF